MQFKGHNEKLSCRWCTVSGIPYIRTIPHAQPAPTEIGKETNCGEDSREMGGARAVVMPPGNEQEDEDQGNEEGDRENEAPAGQTRNAKKDKTTTTYYVARRPEDVPPNLQERNIVDINYTNLPRRTDSQVKSDVNHIIEPGISKKERERRAMATGISGAVSLKSDCQRYASGPNDLPFQCPSRFFIP